MGQSAQGPITDKESGDAFAEELGIWWGYSGMQGWRDGMEDAHICVPSLGAASLSSSSTFFGGPVSHKHLQAGWEDTAVFGVLDGHGGEAVARFCQRHLPEVIARGPSEDIAGSLVDAFHHMDEMLFDPDNLGELRSLVNGMGPQAQMRAWNANPNGIGSTAVVCCLRNNSLTVANAGDSRAVLCRRGRALDLSEDHKPNLPGERARIDKAGGSVEEQRVGPWTFYRVNGNLNLSRSIGDLGYQRNQALAAKDQMICATPDVRSFQRQAGDEFMLLACDGVWDVMSSQEAVDHCRHCLGDTADLEQRLRSGQLRLSTVVESLLDRCLSPDLQLTLGLGGDNMTAILVVFVGSAAAVNNSFWPEASLPQFSGLASSPGGNGTIAGNAGLSFDDDGTGVVRGRRQNFFCPHC